MSANKKQVAAAAAAVTAVMTTLATLTVTFGVEAGLIALVFAVAAVGVGAPTMALVQISRSAKPTGRPAKPRNRSGR
jgi:hypothetical protein